MLQRLRKRGRGIARRGVGLILLSVLLVHLRMLLLLLLERVRLGSDGRTKVTAIDRLGTRGVAVHPLSLSRTLGTALSELTLREKLERGE